MYRWILEDQEKDDSILKNCSIWEYYSDGIAISFGKTLIKIEYGKEQIKDLLRAGRIELVTGAEADRLTEQFNNLKIQML
jgi:hypothetical protein